MLVKGLELNGSVTYADSKITQNDKFPASVGKWQPRVPRWRAALLASYAVDERWSASVGMRYSGRQFGQLDNSDTNGFAFTGFSKFFVVDLRAQLPALALVGDLGRDRQSQQLPLLGVPPVSAAHLSRRAALRPVARRRTLRRTT